MYYTIGSTLEKTQPEKIFDGTAVPYVAVIDTAEWQRVKDSFDMGIDLDVTLSEIYSTKAEVNFDSLTGSFAVPDRGNFEEDNKVFAFALDEKGIVFIDESGMAKKLTDQIRHFKKWRFPSVERFLYDFIELIVHDDLRIMEGYEQELDRIEALIASEPKDEYMSRVNEIRNNIRYLRIHYEQLIDLSQELEENENNFFKNENLRYFRLITNRIERLHDNAAYLRDYTVQLSDMYHMQLEARQNRIMSVLTVVSTIFMPLTLIVGWYGMNFKYMPELEYRASYPIVGIVCVLIIILGLVFFKKKKLL